MFSKNNNNKRKVILFLNKEKDIIKFFKTVI